MGTDLDWNDYLEPEIDGPEVHCVYLCPKCGYREVVPEAGNAAWQCALTITCPKCKTKMYEDAEF